MLSVNEMLDGGVWLLQAVMPTEAVCVQGHLVRRWWLQPCWWKARTTQRVRKRKIMSRKVLSKRGANMIESNKSVKSQIAQVYCLLHPLYCELEWPVSAQLRGGQKMPHGSALASDQHMIRRWACWDSAWATFLGVLLLLDGTLHPLQYWCSFHSLNLRVRMRQS